jgi:hypothetical protein
MSYGHLVSLVTREDSRCGHLEMCSLCSCLMHTRLMCSCPVHSTPLFALYLVGAIINENIKSTSEHYMLAKPSNITCIPTPYMCGSAGGCRSKSPTAALCPWHTTHRRPVFTGKPQLHL